MSIDSRAALRKFLDSPVDRPVLGLLYGRRRIGKSTLLVEETQAREGFYYEATRVESAVQLDRLGRAIGEHLGIGRIALEDWDQAIAALLQLSSTVPIPVVLDEFGHILEADPSVASVLASALGPGARRRSSGLARVVLCGSAIAMMRALTGGEAPLRGRAGLELVMHPDDFRVAARRLPNPTDLSLAARVFAVIGGVVGYATDMVNFDLPKSVTDLDRWIVERVLSPAATLHHEAITLLAEDPTLAGSTSMLHHSILAAIANGSVTAGSIAQRVGRPVSNLAPALNRLVDAGFVLRHEDPIRSQRPLYALSDSFLQFHYAVLEPHRSVFRDRDPAMVWRTRLRPVFDSQVRGPVFEEQARTWIRRFADDHTLTIRDHVGPSSVAIEGVEHQLDVVVSGAGDSPSKRDIVAIGEAKAGERLSSAHLRRMERARAAFGPRASQAKIFLFGPESDPGLAAESNSRSDVEIVNLERLYHGS